MCNYAVSKIYQFLSINYQLTFTQVTCIDSKTVRNVMAAALKVIMTIMSVLNWFSLFSEDQPASNTVSIEMLTTSLALSGE